MQLNDTQQTAVRQWVAEGCTLAELQKKINTEFHLGLTFMDVRFLILDMGLQIKDRDVVGTVDLSKGPAAVEKTATADAMPTGRLSVTLDRVVKPGAVVSGRVTFSDGVSAEWMLDQMGRMGLSAGRPGYRPSPEDLQSFQEELAQLLQNQGI